MLGLLMPDQNMMLVLALRLAGDAQKAKHPRVGYFSNCRTAKFQLVYSSFNQTHIPHEMMNSFDFQSYSRTFYFIET